jgi:hypothetical protein
MDKTYKYKIGSCKKDIEFLNIPIFEGLSFKKLNKIPPISIAVKIKKKAKRRLLSLCSVLTVNKNKDRNNEINIIITTTVISKLNLSI